MKKLLNVILTVVILAAAFCGCSNEKYVDENTTKANTTMSVTETAKTTVTSTTHPTQKQTTTTTTTKKNLTTTKQNTTTKTQTTTATTKKVTTSQMVTTVRPTTTQTKTTTEPYFCYEGGSVHVSDVGQIGWHNSYEETENAITQYFNEHPNLTHYTIARCTCGLYTAYIK